MEALGDFLRGELFQDRDFNEHSDGIEITEIFQQEDLIDLETRKIANADVVPWLDQHFVVAEGAQKSDCTMRIVWAKWSTDWDLDIKKRIYESLLERFELKRARQLLPRNRGIICLPVEHQNKQSFALWVPGIGLDILGTYNLITNSAEVIWAYYDTNFLLLSHVQDILQRQKRLARHPMFIIFIAAVLLSFRTDKSLDGLNENISQVERRTRHSDLNGMSYPVADGSYASLSARMSGSATIIAHMEWMNTNRWEILDCLSSYRWPPGIERPECVRNSDKEINDCARVLKAQAKAQEHSLRFHSRRVDIQLTALFHLITREETRLGISVAKDSRTIASATKEDSTAMKTLAAVTVVFLPSTFVAALFSMPLFQWDTRTLGHSAISKQFWIFWVVSIPLTIVTLILWFAWMRLQTRRRRAREQEDAEEMDELEDTETSSELRDVEAINREITEKPKGKLRKRARGVAQSRRRLTKAVRQW